MRGESADDVAKRLPRKRGKKSRKRRATASYVRMIEAGTRPLALPASVQDAAKAYLLPLEAFCALRAGRIRPETALKSSLDAHVADCCTEGTA